MPDYTWHYQTLACFDAYISWIGMYSLFLSPCRSGNILECLHRLLQLIHLCVQITSTLVVLVVVHSADSN